MEFTTDTGFLAKYDGKCLLCGLAIHVGHDHIVSLPGTKFCYRHTDCTLAHTSSQVRRFMDDGKDVAGICDMYYAEIAAGRVDFDTANQAMNYAAEYAERIAA